MSPTPLQLREYLNIAHEWVWQAGKISMRYFQTGVRADRKADNSPVTIADRETERFLRESILRHFPTHAIMGEEDGGENAGAEWRWLIDPIDGTRAFMHGVPIYGTLLGLEYRGNPVLGIIHCPAMGDTVCAADGCGCYWNGRVCHVSSTATLDKALAVSWTARFERFGQEAVLAELQRQVEDFRTWGDAYGYVLVATGRADVLIDPEGSEWDVAPMLPIFREAGGKFSDWKGEETHRSGNSVVTNGLLHEDVIKLIQEFRA